MNTIARLDHKVSVRSMVPSKVEKRIIAFTITANTISDYYSGHGYYFLIPSVGICSVNLKFSFEHFQPFFEKVPIGYFPIRGQVIDETGE